MFKATKDSQIEDELKSRLETKGRDAAVRIDGILAMNDFTAAASIKALKTMGYSGSSMDVNPPSPFSMWWATLQEGSH